MNKRNLDQNSVADVNHFEKIYEENLWASGSGTGSRFSNNFDYVSLLNKFIQTNDIRSVVDLGCGDWQFSKFIDWGRASYIGYDVVQSVIQKNKLSFSSDTIIFDVAPALNHLPVADLYICKDVLQHLPLEQIRLTLAAMLIRCKWLLVTNDDYPIENLNGEIKPGEWRALRLDASPFNFVTATLIRTAIVSETPTVIKRTCLIKGSHVTRRVVRDNSETIYQSSTIPKKLLQTWKTRLLTGNFAVWSETIRSKNPDYEWIITDDDDNRNFIRVNYPWFLAKYDSFDRMIMRVDALRYFWLYTYGGFYLDLDVECLSSLDQHLVAGDIVFGQMGPDPDFHDAIPNAIMASRPRQDFWLYVMFHLLNGSSSGPPETVTGPSFLTYCVRQWETQPEAVVRDAIAVIQVLLLPTVAFAERTRIIRVLPSRVWYPLDWSDRLHQRVRKSVLSDKLLSEDEKRDLFPTSTLITYWSHSW